MRDNGLALAGISVFVGVAQFILFMNIASYLYPGYSVSTNYISDLGVGPSAIIFNTSIILLGLLGLVGAYLLYRSGVDRVFVAFLVLASLGAAGVGAFPENMGAPHTVSAFITFLFAGLGAVYSVRIDLTKLRVVWPILGVISLVALALYASKSYMGLGKGGMERMIVYPVLIWLLGLSATINSGKVKHKK